ncbi:MAG: glycosyltransferase family 39 protein, partial [bacterium]|nr:glycosyltransferase family 39 protein [bacterium]
MKVEELTRRFVWLLVVAAVVRLGCVVFVPLELIPDEAYYWDWSRRLDWCYYSKPPMVAWLIGATTRMLGSYEWSVRLPAAVLNIVTLSVVGALGKRMYGGRVAWLGALAFLAVPGASVSGLLMTIDAPLLSFWAFGLLSVWEALNTRGARSVVWWWAAGMAGAGGVLSKQMMLVFPALTVLYCLVSGEKRRGPRGVGIFVFLGG